MRIHQQKATNDMAKRGNCPDSKTNRIIFRVTGHFVISRQQCITIFAQ